MCNPLFSVLFSPVYSSTCSKLSLKRTRWCTAAAIGIACAGAICTPAIATDLIIKVDGIREARGTIRLELDGSAAAWDKKEKPTALGSTPAVLGVVTYTFKGLPPGRYAVGVYHDANDNGELDMNFLGHLTNALFAASRHKMLRIFIHKGLAGAPPEALAATRLTATNPAVVDAFALVIIADGHGVAYPGLARTTMDLAAAHKDARDIDLAAAELRKIAPNAGSYVSEGNYFNRSWQNEYWGTNYSQLRAIKTKYDPDGLFFVHHGVGSEDWSADGFTPLT